MSALPIPSADEEVLADDYAPVIEPFETEARERQATGRRPTGTAHRTENPKARWRGLWRAWRPFLAVVVAPTLIVAAYYFLIAADQYQSEAHIIVRSSGSSGGGVSGLSQALGLDGGSLQQSGAHAINDYLVSQDAAAALGHTIDLAAVFRRPEADWLSQLHGGSKPPPETVLKYFRRRVKVSFSGEGGITTLTVRAFRPDDAHEIAERLLELGEARVNAFNQRALDNTLSVARTQLAQAEQAVAATQGSVTDFRQEQRDIDPDRNSAAQIELSTSLQQQLAQARAQLASISAAVDANSPQRVALANQVHALEIQVAGVQAHMAGPAHAMAQGLGAYESLRLRQEFASKRYEAAAATLEAARTEALKQQLFVVRVVEPNLPVKALYPERLKTLALVFFGLLLLYAIGWLILAGVREHAA